MNNLLSLALGLTAWVLPLIALLRRKRQPLLCCASFAACALSLLLQLREIMYRAGIGDFAAIEDTIRAVNICAIALVIVTVALNTVVLLRRKR